MAFNFTQLSIPEVVLIEPTRHHDARGFFSETFRASAFDSHVGATFVQDNFVRSGPQVVRGLHYQLSPRPQGKLIQVLRGHILDIAVDLRRSSATFGQWVGQEISDTNGEILWIPPGFGHGYAVLSDGADVMYKVTEEYDATLDRGIRWNDPDLAVTWPSSDAVLSEKDRALPLLSETADLFA